MWFYIFVLPGNAVKYSSIEESAYTSVTPAPLYKQAVYSAPVATKAYLPPVKHVSYAAPVITKSYLPPVTPTYTAPVVTKSFLPPVTYTGKLINWRILMHDIYWILIILKKNCIFTAPLSKVATYTPTSSVLAVPAVKTVAYPRVTPRYLPPAPKLTINTPLYTAPVVTKYASAPVYKGL